MKAFIDLGDKHVKDLIKGGGITLLFYGLNLIMVYLIALFISKNYGSEIYGRFSIIKSLILVLIIISTLGLNTLMIKLSSDVNFFKNGIFKTDFFAKSYIIVFIFSASVSIFFFLISEQIATNIFKDVKLIPYFKVFPFLLMGAVFLNMNSNLLKGQGKVLTFAIISSFLGNFILLTTTMIIFKLYSRDEFYLIILFLISIVVSLLVSFYFILPIRYSRDFYTEKAHRLFSLSLPMMASASMIYIIFSSDILILGFFETSERVGVYRIVSQIASVNSLFVIAFGTVLGPKISNLYSEKKDQELKRNIFSATKLIFFITLPVLFLIIVFSRKILLFFGPEYITGLKSLVLLSVCQFLYAITGFSDLILNMTHHQKAFSKITLITASINLVLNFILIPLYGIFGAALATGISIVLTNLISVIYINKKFNILLIYFPFLNS